MNFSDALRALKDGYDFSRGFWNGSDIHIRLTKNDDDMLIGLYDCHGFVCRWTPLQTDILSDDWLYVRDLGENCG